MSHSRPTPAPLFLGALALTAAAASLFASLAFAAPGDAKKPPTSAPHAKPAATLSEDEKIVHVLNRLGYGPRPGDVERVKAMGLSRYIDLQLNPDRVPDTALDTKLAAFTTLNMSAEQLATEYHALVQSSKEEQALRRQMRKQAGGANGGAAQQAGGANNAAQPAAGADTTPAGGAGDAQAPAGGAKKRAKRPQGMTPDARREARQARQMMSQTATPIAQAHAEFMAAKALRAIESERQLQEVLVDFWGNHFNIDIRKQPCGVLKILDDRDTIRPHIFGKFRDLLGASAKSPAMLVYLDNYQSMSATAPAGPAGRNRANRARRLQRLGITDATAQTPAMPPNRARRLQRLGPANPAAQTAAVPPKAKKRRPTGLNENYAREIMELHTLGVDGGYTQKDVTEVARCLTGWSVSADGRRPGMGKYAEAGAFHFYPAMHDNGEKTVLGHVIPAGGGEKDGEMVLDILASHPATMRHVSEQLCQRLVA
ncbi:MAG TPA: DUF1800 family protein, partial [Chthonomonadaceae bacterium]|nr:DUF1800 family protein [Chthonomonadaceae bacterium]